MCVRAFDGQLIEGWRSPAGTEELLQHANQDSCGK